MGTRALIHVKEGKNTLVTIYRQFDGYPTGLGEDIKQILNKGNVKLLNGISGDAKLPSHFNGLGCLAPYLISQLKDQIGNVYIMAPNISDVGEEYVYTLTDSKGILNLKVTDGYNNDTLYNGPLSEFNSKKVQADE